MKLLCGIILLIHILHLCRSQKSCFCDNCKGLENRDSFYNFSISPAHGNPRRMLRGTKKQYGCPAGRATHTLRIEGSVHGSDFDVSRLCLMTKNVLTIAPSFESSHSPDTVRVAPDGQVGLSGIGSALAGESVITVKQPTEWQKNCITSTGFMSVVSLSLAPANPREKMMMKALYMHACPHRVGPPPPVCDENQQFLGNGGRYFSLKASHAGAERALNGSKRAVRAPTGQSLDFTISPPEGDDGFVITQLCIDSKNADEVTVEYVGMPRVSVSESGAMRSTGGGVSGDKALIESSDWTSTCFSFDPVVRSRVTVTVSSSNKQERVVAKGLVMGGCPYARS